MAIRCIIVDDNRGFLESARSVLEAEGLKVLAVATTSHEALQQVEALRPTVTLVDVYLGSESGLDLARRLADGTGGAHSKVILISTYDEMDLADLVGNSSALGLLTKSRLSAEAVRAVLEYDEG